MITVTATAFLKHPIVFNLKKSSMFLKMMKTLDKKITAKEKKKEIKKKAVKKRKHV